MSVFWTFLPFSQTFSSLFVCIRFGGHPLFLSFLIHARLSWDRGRIWVRGLAQRTWPRKDQAYTEIWGEIPQLHPVWGDSSLLPAVAASKDPHLPLGRDWSTQARSKNHAADPITHPRTALKPLLCQKSLCCIIQIYKILSAASLHVLNRAPILRCLDSSFISGDGRTLL